MYGLSGERRLTEFTLDWLPGYEGSVPVRVGNGAFDQYQLDVMGEVAMAMYSTAKLKGGVDLASAQAFVRVGRYGSPAIGPRIDRGIWEMRGPDRPFTASKNLRLGSAGSLHPGRARVWLRRTVASLGGGARRIHNEVCEKGFDPKRNTFTQYYGSEELDASLLAVPWWVFFRPPTRAAWVR